MVMDSNICTDICARLRRLGVEPYSKLSEIACKQIGDGVRLLSLLEGERFVTPQAGQRIAVLSGRVQLEPQGESLDLDNTRERVRLTASVENVLLATEPSVVLLADAEFLDTLASWTELTAYAEQSGADEVFERLNTVKHAVAFRRLPLEHVFEAVQLMQPKRVSAGDVIVTQGERGDAFYLIRSGRAEVWKSGIYDDVQQMVDTMGPGDTFGDEALVMGGTRNATVRMIDDGELLVLGEQAFKALISRPMIEEVPPARAQRMLEDDWRVLDVRYEEEFEDGHIPDALLLPLFELRQKADQVLDRQARYITVCLSGKRSTVAAFLLKQRGYEVVAMASGMSAWEGETVC